MPIFTYTATDNTNRRKSGELEARDRASAIGLLEKEKLTVLSLREKGKIRAVGKGSSAGPISFFNSISMVDKVLLTKHLATVIKAGLPILEAIDVLREDAKNPMLKKILFEARSSLERGQQLSSVFAQYPRHFSPIFVGLIRAGEKSGTLEIALNSLGEQLIRDNDLIKKARSALVYPAILLIASIAVVVLMLTFLLPRLLKVFEATRVTLPLITRIFVRASDILSANPLLTVGVFLFLILGAVATFRSSQGRKRLIAFLQNLPVSGGVVRQLAIARFARTLNNLLKSGMGAVESLEVTAQSVGNRTYEKAILAAAEDLKKGGQLASSLAVRRSLFPRLLVSMIVVGERTGTLEKALGTVADYYDEEADRSLKGLVGLLEPLLLVIMGLVVGGIALSIMLPIYQMVGSIR